MNSCKCVIAEHGYEYGSDARRVLITEIKALEWVLNGS